MSGRRRESGTQGALRRGRAIARPVTAAEAAAGGVGSGSGGATLPINLASDVTGDLPFANLTQIAGLSVLGVTGAATADVAAITAGTDKQVLRRSGTGLSFGAIDISSSSAVTGDLAFANLAQGAALSVLGVAGNAIADVASIVAASDGQVLLRSGTTIAFGAVSLSTAAAVTGRLPYANLAQGTALSVLGVAGNANADNASIVAGSDGQVLLRSGTSIVFGAVSLATAAAVTGKLPWANLADVSATSRILGRTSAGSGVIEEMTLSAALDLIGSAAQGDVLYRGSSAWLRLGAGTNGQFLSSGGPAANIAWANASGVGGGAAPAGQTMRFEGWCTNNGIFKAYGPLVDGTYSGTTNVPATVFSDAFYWQFTTSTTSGTAATATLGASNGGGMMNLSWDFDFTVIMRTDISNVTNILYWFGFSNGNPGNSDTVASNSIMFRFSTNAGDGGWVGVTYDGTQAVTATVASIAANTRYKLRIRKVGGTVFFSVNGGTETSTTSHVPTNDTYRFPVLAVTTKTNAARNMFLSRIFCDYAS